MSILFVWVVVVLVVLKGLTLVDTRCPKVEVLFGLSQEGAYTSRYQMPKGRFERCDFIF